MPVRDLKVSSPVEIQRDLSRPKGGSESVPPAPASRYSTTDSRIASLISRNLERIRENIAEYGVCEEVTIVAITKYVVGPEIVEILPETGLTDIGENRIKEGIEKFSCLKRFGGKVRRHLVGPVQSNKAKLIPGNFDCVQSLCSEKIASILDHTIESGQHLKPAPDYQPAALDTRLPILIEVNISREPQKSGVHEEVLPELIESIRKYRNLRVSGLMAIPQPFRSEREARSTFSSMRELFEKMKNDHFKDSSDFKYLSMGMTDDYLYALMEGTNMLRIGRALYEGLESNREG